jgi:hypothetical protein
MTVVLQRILFPTELWTVDEMIKWLAVHGFVPIKMTKEGNYYHARMRIPKRGAKYRQKKVSKGLIFTFMY